AGGTNNAGTVFRLNKNGSNYEILHHFGYSDTDGQNPQAGLIEGSDGALYGTSMAGGANGSSALSGSVFRLKKNGSDYCLLHSFGAPKDGSQPRAELLEGNDGALYGTTYQGGTNSRGGTLLQLN